MIETEMPEEPEPNTPEEDDSDEEAEAIPDDGDE